jgi:hypothetical protein
VYDRRASGLDDDDVGLLGETTITETMTAPRPDGEPPSADPSEEFHDAEVLPRDASPVRRAPTALTLEDVQVFVRALDKELNSTWALLAIVGLAVCGLAFVLLPAISVVAVGSGRFPETDYIVTSAIGATLLVGSVAGIVAVTRGKERVIHAYTEMTTQLQEADAAHRASVSAAQAI